MASLALIDYSFFRIGLGNNIPFVKSIVLLSVFLCAGFHSLAQNSKLVELQDDLAKATDNKSRAHALNALSYELRKSDTSKTRLYASEALRLAQGEGYKAEEAASYANIAEYYRAANNLEKAVEYFHKAIDIYEAEDLKAELSKGYNKLGVVFQSLSDYEQALYYYEKSLFINKEINDNQALSGVHNNIGTIHFIHGDYQHSLEHFLASLKIREQSGDKAGIAASYNNIANIYTEQHNYKLGIDYYMRGIQIREELKDWKGLSNTYSNLGALYYMAGENKRAMQFYKEAMEINEMQNDNSQLAGILVNIGNIARDEGDHIDAIENYKQAGEIYKALGDKRGTATSIHAIGVLYSRMKNYSVGIEHMEKALVIAKEIGIRDEIRNLYASLAEAHENKGDFREANKYYRNFISMKDSLHNEASAKMLAELDLKYRSGKKQKEIDLLKKEKEIQDVKLDRNRLFMYSSLGGVVLLLIFALVIFKNNRQKQKVNNDLIEKNREISLQKKEKEVLLKEIHHRVKNNLQVINSLLNIQSAYIEEPKVLSLFTDCQNRIRTMALIHEKLYSTEDLNKVELRAYIESLVGDLFRTYRLDQNISLNLNISEKNFGINTLIPMGLILNELISNSLKHAFLGDNEKGEIKISIQRVNEDLYEMIIGDNGMGMKDDTIQNPNSLGIELVHTFVSQLEGTIEKVNGKGTVYRILFRDQDLRSKDQEFS